jgi:hypothetical protein
LHVFRSTPLRGTVRERCFSKRPRIGFKTQTAIGRFRLPTSAKRWDLIPTICGRVLASGKLRSWRAGQKPRSISSSQGTGRKREASSLAAEAVNVCAELLIDVCRVDCIHLPKHEAKQSRKVVFSPSSVSVLFPQSLKAIKSRTDRRRSDGGIKRVGLNRADLSPGLGNFA